MYEAFILEHMFYFIVATYLLGLVIDTIFVAFEYRSISVSSDDCQIAVICYDVLTDLVKASDISAIGQRDLMRHYLMLYLKSKKICR